MEDYLSYVLEKVNRIVNTIGIVAVYKLDFCYILVNSNGELPLSIYSEIRFLLKSEFRHWDIFYEDDLQSYHIVNAYIEEDAKEYNRRENLKELFNKL